MNALVFFLLLAATVQAEPAWLESHSRALAQAKASGESVLIEFQAPWCYSCYYMAHNVLSREDFSRVAQRLVLLKADVDSEEGRGLKEKYGVTMLPGFVVLSPEGAVLGRISGEQTEADFLARLKTFLKGASADPDDQAVAGLQQRLAAGEMPEAAKAIARLPAERLGRLRGRKDWSILEARLDLSRSQGAAAAKPIKSLLKLDDSCELAYDVEQAENSLASLPAAQQKALREDEQSALESLAARRLFKPAPERCADFRSGVEALAAVYEKLGKAPQREQLLRRALAFLDGMGPETGIDRNHDDDRRFFLELSGADAELRAFLDQLIKAYPFDYVYPYRYARYLLAKNDADAALRWAETADKLSYGANRLVVTKLRAKALIALGRKGEAASLLTRDIKAGKAFPDEKRQLEDLLVGLGRQP
jgi:thiol-disulfide isomerase/thioredoxin